jgi:hypothetical protein
MAASPVSPRHSGSGFQLHTASLSFGAVLKHFTLELLAERSGFSKLNRLAPPPAAAQNPSGFAVSTFASKH